MVAEVDHFIPWARYPDNSIDNFVVADSRCNGLKRDFLAASEHVKRWTARFDSKGTVFSSLRTIAERQMWEHHPQRTLGVARATYLHLPVGRSRGSRRRISRMPTLWHWRKCLQVDEFHNVIPVI